MNDTSTTTTTTPSSWSPSWKLSDQALHMISAFHLSNDELNRVASASANANNLSTFIHVAVVTFAVLILVMTAVLRRSKRRAYLAVFVLYVDAFVITVVHAASGAPKRSFIHGAVGWLTLGLLNVVLVLPSCFHAKTMPSLVSSLLAAATAVGVVVSFALGYDEASGA
jgi:hypothetical protein